MKIPFLALLVTACLAICAQTPATSSFEVATIHPVEPGSRNEAGIHIDERNLSVRNYTLRDCIEFAWEVQPFQIEGPGWLSDEHFDIAAKTASDISGDEAKTMFRTLLAQRFGLKLHHEQKEMPVYLLVLAKNGPYLHDTGKKDTSKFLVSNADGPTNFHEERNGAMAERTSMAEFAQRISKPAGRPVIDRTGLQGHYDLRIDLAPFMTVETADGAKVDSVGVLLSGLQDQLGLKVDPKKESFDFLVVDAVNKVPTEN